MSGYLAEDDTYAQANQYIDIALRCMQCTRLIPYWKDHTLPVLKHIDECPILGLLLSTDSQYQVNELNFLFLINCFSSI